MDAELIMLGTGNATVTRCYNTCFVLRTEGTVLLVDGGGGNGVLGQLERAGVALEEVHDVYVTHAHTDHVLGVVWVVRMAAQRMLAGKYEGVLRVYSHDKVLRALEEICRLTLPGKVTGLFGNRIEFWEVEDGDAFEVGDLRMRAFDIASTKEKQFGFRAELPDGQVLACLGDEPYNPVARPYAEGADWLLCEAFCLYRDREVFKPYEKHHSTALEAGRLAQELGVRHLVLYHTEDKTLAGRRALYTEEASREFAGVVHVPEDLERIPLGQGGESYL